MIGASPVLKAAAVQPMKNPVSALAGISRPRFIADKTTEAAANNAIASGYQKGYARPALGTKAGFSVNAMDRMKAAQQAAAGIAEGASNAAGIRAEDQAFNNSQEAAYQSLIGERLNATYGLDTQAQGADWERRFAAKKNRYQLMQDMQQAQMRLRLALLSQME